MIKLCDTTLRDGSHSAMHRFTVDDIKRVAKALDEAGIDMIEVGHGDGISGSTINYGFALQSDAELLAAAASVIKKAKLAALLLPGIGSVEDLEALHEAGITAVRVATHVTEADVSAQHIKAAREMGLFTVGFLMMSHMAEADRIVEEAKKMESYGAEVVYVTDSGGAMLPDEVKRKISAVKEAVSIPVGHHAHHNLGMAVANSLAAIEAGASYIDGSLAGLGAGAGNTPTEMLIAALNKAGIAHDADLFKAMDVAEHELKPILKRIGCPYQANHDALMVGYAGVYSSFMLHARRAAERFGVDVRNILIELGRQGAVGGQEDMILEVASRLSKQ